MRRWIFVVVGIVVVLGAAQYALQRLGQAQLDRFVDDSRGWATINVRRARFWLWGVVDLRSVEIRPTAWLAAFYGLPLGYSVHVDALRVHHFVPGWNGGLVLASVAFDARGVRIPALPWQWSVSVARGPQDRPLRAPTLADLGVDGFDFDVSGTAGFRAGFAHPTLEMSTRLTSLADLTLHCVLGVPGRIAADPGSVVIKRCRLDYRDRGLIPRFEAEMARRNHLSVAQLQTALARQVENLRWPRGSRRAVQRFVRHPERGLRLGIQPPQPLSLNDIPRGVWPGLPHLLGLTASLPARKP